jgi:uncharacterized membrane protein YoaK (UPF0700 family)
VTRYDRRSQALAICLAALAGFVDALGFMHLHGFFVSFMSGNSTRLAVGLAAGSAEAIRAGSLILLFVTGVMLGALAARVAPSRGRQIVLLLIGALLAVGGAAVTFGLPLVAVTAMVLAMGAENAVFGHGGEVHIGLTYMTGALVKLGQHLADALTGGERIRWLSYLLLWSGLVGGAVAGACVYEQVGLQGLWLAAAIATGCALWAPKGDGMRGGASE